jgi:hypothetical protein
MTFQKLISTLSASVILFGGMMLTACGSEGASQDDELLGEEVGSGAEAELVDEAQQALVSCTPYGSGSGTWGGVIALCTSDGSLYAKKHSGTFTSSGPIKLYKTNGALVGNGWASAGTSSVWFGFFPSGCYYAKFFSDAPGVAYTATLCQ